MARPPRQWLLYKDQRLTIAEAVALSGHPRSRIWRRLMLGWSVADALERPNGWWPGRPRYTRLERAIAAYLDEHPAEARRLAQKYGWTDD